MAPQHVPPRCAPPRPRVSWPCASLCPGLARPSRASPRPELSAGEPRPTSAPRSSGARRPASSPTATPWEHRLGSGPAPAEDRVRHPAAAALDPRRNRPPPKAGDEAHSGDLPISAGAMPCRHMAGEPLGAAPTWPPYACTRHAHCARRVCPGRYGLDSRSGWSDPAPKPSSAAAREPGTAGAGEQLRVSAGRGQGSVSCCVH
uniref:Uncharacterized protein n=1 Tax=Setaria viridis TaxID=4556 RepID=A0A4V6D6R1_SETVI|nr:hypothetical protein SEVIR_5G234300v2 [Setaria viridis]